MDPKYESEGERKSEYIKEDFSSSDWRRESKIAGYEEEEEIKSKCRHDANAHDAGNDSSGSDAEVEAEYLAAMRAANVGKVGISKDPEAKSVVDGFRIKAEFSLVVSQMRLGSKSSDIWDQPAIPQEIKVKNWMDMRDARTSRLLWESGEWSKEMFHIELKATVPREILECDAVSREINFSSEQEIRRFHLEQRVFLEGSCIEEWFFDFGFVIPGSSNSWQQTIQSAGKDHMLSADDISGKMTIETTFLDGAKVLCKTLVRIFYE